MAGSVGDRSVARAFYGYVHADQRFTVFVGDRPGDSLDRLHDDGAFCFLPFHQHDAVSLHGIDNIGVLEYVLQDVCNGLIGCMYGNLTGKVYFVLIKYKQVIRLLFDLISTWIFMFSLLMETLATCELASVANSPVMKMKRDAKVIFIMRNICLLVIFNGI